MRHFHRKRVWATSENGDNVKETVPRSYPKSIFENINHISISTKQQHENVHKTQPRVIKLSIMGCWRTSASRSERNQLEAPCGWTRCSNWPWSVKAVGGHIAEIDASRDTQHVAVEMTRRTVRARFRCGWKHDSTIQHLSHMTKNTGGRSGEMCCYF